MTRGMQFMLYNVQVSMWTHATSAQNYHTRCGSFLQVQQGDDSFIQSVSAFKSYLCLSFRNLTPKINPHTCFHHKKTTQIP